MIIWEAVSGTVTTTPSSVVSCSNVKLSAGWLVPNKRA